MTPDRPPPPVARSGRRRRVAVQLVAQLQALGVDTPAARLAAALERLVPPGETTTTIDNRAIAQACTFPLDVRVNRSWIKGALAELEEAGAITRTEARGPGAVPRVITLHWREEDEAC